jgi:chromosome partitioning protein
VSSHLGLINVDLELATELGAANLRQGKLNYLRVHRRPADELSKPDFARYDLVLIDCPPNFNVVTKTAIVASDCVLIPAKADYLSTLGIAYLQRSLAELVRDYNEYTELDAGDGPTQKVDPQILGIVFTMIQYYAKQPIRAHRQYINQAKQLHLPVFNTYLRENKSYFADAAHEGIPLVLGGPTPAEFIVAEIEALVSEFESRLGIERNV